MAFFGLNCDVTAHLLYQGLAGEKSFVALISKHFIYLFICKPMAIIYDLQFDVDKFFITELKGITSTLRAPFERVPCLTLPDKIFQPHEYSNIPEILDRVEGLLNKRKKHLYKPHLVTLNVSDDTHMARMVHLSDQLNIPLNSFKLQYCKRFVNGV